MKKCTNVHQVFCYLCCSLLALVSLRCQSQSDTVEILGKYLHEKNSICRFSVLKVLQGTTQEDTISVQFNGESPILAEEYTVLTVQKSPNENVYHFPENNSEKHMTKAIVFVADFNTWEACEMGTKNCKPFYVQRKEQGDRVFFIAPCGGTETAASFSGISETFSSLKTPCPPVFELTNLPDGKYVSSIQSCGLGGSVDVYLKTVNK
jgi:hypothetical protein